MKIGLYFGSFNPVHIGHLAIANYIAEWSDLDELWFVISPQNPLKQKSSLLADYHRLEMVNLSIGKYSKFRTTDIEFKLPKPSYTIDTLTYLKERHPSNEFVLIMGSDNLESFHKWKNYEQILKDFELIVYPRPGYKGSEFDSLPNVLMVEAPNMEISSSFIRKALQEKKDVRFFLPDKVYEYIDLMNFYK